MKIEKFLLWTVTFALVFVGFSGAGLAQENSQPQRIIVEPKLPFKVSVWVDKGYGSTYRIGESLIVYFESSRDWSKTIFVERGRTSYVFARLKPSYHYRKGSIRVSSQPSRARVFLDGVDKGKTPLTIRGLKVGWHELAVIKEDYRIYVKDVYVGRRERVYLEVELEKLGVRS